MKKILLNEKTKNLLKTADQKIKEQTEKLQQVQQSFQTVLQSLNEQKKMALLGIIMQNDDPDVKNWTLNKDYDLEEVEEQKFEDLAKDPANALFELPPAEIEGDGTMELEKAEKEN